MRSSAKHGEPDNRGISGHVLTLHQRLHHALNLGSWENRKKWHCSDIEVQRLVLRSIDAFLDCISTETLQYPLVKDSAVEMVRALESILQFKNQSILKLASNVAVKMVHILPSSMLRSHVLDLICPLADLLSSQQLQVAMSCATALNVILSKLSSRQESQVWQILKETTSVGCIIHNIKQFHAYNKPMEYFQEMSSVLSKILWRWPSFRFSVWNDSAFLNVLDAIKFMSENSVKVAVLQLYSSLALCSNGAKKLLENGESLLQMILGCMDSSNSNLVRVEAFRLARCLALSRGACMKMMNLCCEPLVKAVASTMKNWSSESEEAAKSQMAIMEEACRLASITHWAGDHHIYFWKVGIDRLLVDLLLGNSPNIHQLQRELTVNDLIIVVRESHNSNLLLSFRPFIWDILGGLAANCVPNINHDMHGNRIQLRILIICACFSFINSLRTFRQVSQNGPTNMSECESASRAVLMMVYSPCKYIAYLARSILCEILKSDGKDHVEYLLEILNSRLTGNKFGLPGNLQTAVSLISLACYCSIPEYEKLIIELQGIKTVVTFIMWWLRKPVHTKRASMVPHLIDSFSERSCCSTGTEEWEGENVLLIFGLWILAELLHHSADKKIHLSDNQEDFSEVQLIQELQEVCRSHNSHGSRWYAAYVLSYFGLFGFPNRLGKRIGKLLGDKEHSDLKLDLVNAESVYVHEVILTVRCPSLLPPGESVPQEKASSGSTVKLDTGRNNIKAVCLSAHVDHQPLLKLLEYVYSGYLQASEDLVKKLKFFARHCKLESLMHMLRRRHPALGISIPSFDLSPALGPAGHHLWIFLAMFEKGSKSSEKWLLQRTASLGIAIDLVETSFYSSSLKDILLEASKTQLVAWKCNSCSALVPHLHAHKVILESSCDYLRALFCSGMQESHLQTVKVPVSWESLDKLVRWFYSDRLPLPTFDCLWDNLDPEKKYLEVQTYVELCWLAEFWLIDDLYEECYEVVVSCLESSTYLSTRIIQTAANFSLWKLAQVAANYMAPSYHHLRNSGGLDAVDNNLVEMVRAASVRLSQDASY